MRFGDQRIGPSALLAVVFVVMNVLRFAAGFYRFNIYEDSGCADGSTEGLQGKRHRSIAACEGAWHGHIELADHLCAPGWRVCSHDNYDLLQTITWADAMAVSGCYAINAAQDGGLCRRCVDDVKQDDMAGVGKGCPHQSYGQKSCISGGQMHVSCCMDSRYNRSCTYRPGLSTGVLCCRLPGAAPQILVEPQSLSHVVSGSTFVLSCQAVGSPIPEVTWHKDGFLLPANEPRIAVFPSGYMVVSESRMSDNGVFRCLASNALGNASADAYVIVSEGDSGCADGSTEGFHHYEDIQACAGRWYGHVKRGRELCARGWKVCSSRDTSLLTLLTWEDVTQLQGCYGYNAENSYNHCGRCHQRDVMAGVGAACGRIQRKHSSCLTQGRIDVYRHKDKVTNGCEYQEGRVDGVVCCRNRKRKASHWDVPKCSPRCANGGTCLPNNRCACAEGFKGAWCQNAICPGGCIHNAICIKPGVCRCKTGRTGEKCIRKKDRCLIPCMNGGRCKRGKCKCAWSHYGEYCQYKMNSDRMLDANRTER